MNTDRLSFRLFAAERDDQYVQVLVGSEVLPFNIILPWADIIDLVRKS